MKNPDAMRERLQGYLERRPRTGPETVHLDAEALVSQGAAGSPLLRLSSTRTKWPRAWSALAR